ncbi:MAG: bifunctional folylpolyglutamate synthase/dihydrofolate synthase [Candidatus Diapherotrites archaeon]|nr:bifunctional folylpolyglutamate synthase/dihydrofolate synthase [Candidatus Diapherotrites archaeon]
MKHHPFLDSLIRTRTPFEVEPLKQALADAGNPEKSFTCVQVAGTNGKGSTAAMTANSLPKCGLFTSPHLHELNERFVVGGASISDPELNEYIEKTRPLAAKHGLSFFETITLLAFLYFADKNCEYAVMEVGMGGRLDATSACDPAVAVITTVDFDHTRHLGTTIAEIAREKAGIIKGGTVVTTEKKPEALEVIKAKCASENARLVLAERKNFSLSLAGDYQQDNAACAYEALLALGVNEAKARTGIEAARWPGRLELINNVLFDCAHNPAAMKALAAYLRGKEFTLVIGMKADKEYGACVSIIAPLAKKVIVTQYTDGPNPLPASELCEAVRELTPNCQAVEDPREALEKAKGFTVVAGSIFLVGELMP